MTYETRGTCSVAIEVELDGDIIQSVEFIGGCSGNTQGIAKLVEGMNAREAIARMRGIRCGSKPTSCPDQIAKAIRLCLAEQA